MATQPIQIKILAENLAHAALESARGDVNRLGAAAQSQGKDFSGLVGHHLRFRTATESGRKAVNALEGGLRTLALQATGTSGPVGKVAQSFLLFSGGSFAVLAAAGAVTALALGVRELTRETREATKAADDFIKAQRGKAEATKTTWQQYKELTAQIDAAIDAEKRAAAFSGAAAPFQLLTAIASLDRGARVARLQEQREEAAVAMSIAAHADRVKTIEQERKKQQDAATAAREREVEQYGRVLTAAERTAIADELRVKRAERLAELQAAMAANTPDALRRADAAFRVERAQGGIETERERAAGRIDAIPIRPPTVLPAVDGESPPEQMDSVLHDVAAGFATAADEAARLNSSVDSLGEVATQFGDAFSDAFAAAAMGSKSLGAALKQAAFGEIRQIAAVKAKYYAAQALAALGEAFVPVFNPQKLLAAAKFTAAAGAFAALGGAASGLAGGGGSGGGSRGAGMESGARSQAAVSAAAPRMITIVQLVSSTTGEVVRQFTADQARYRNLGGRVPGVEAQGSTIPIPGVVVVGA